MKQLGAVLWLVLAVAIVSASVSGGAPGADKRGSDKTPTDIKATLLELADKIDRLEARVEELETSRTIALPTIPPRAQRQLVPKDWQGRQFKRGSVPKNWQGRQFNGIEYYIVPLGEKRKP